MLAAPSWLSLKGRGRRRRVKRQREGEEEAAADEEEEEERRRRLHSTTTRRKTSKSNGKRAAGRRSLLPRFLADLLQRNPRRHPAGDEQTNESGATTPAPGNSSSSSNSNNNNNENKPPPAGQMISEAQQQQRDECGRLIETKHTTRPLADTKNKQQKQQRRQTGDEQKHRQPEEWRCELASKKEARMSQLPYESAPGQASEANETNEEEEQHLNGDRSRVLRGQQQEPCKLTAKVQHNKQCALHGQSDWSLAAIGSGSRPPTTTTDQEPRRRRHRHKQQQQHHRARCRACQAESGHANEQEEAECCWCCYCYCCCPAEGHCQMDSPGRPVRAEQATEGTASGSPRRPKATDQLSERRRRRLEQHRRRRQPFKPSISRRTRQLVGSVASWPLGRQAIVRVIDKKQKPERQRVDEWAPNSGEPNGGRGESSYEAQGMGRASQRGRSLVHFGDAEDIQSEHFAGRLKPMVMFAQPQAQLDELALICADHHDSELRNGAPPTPPTPKGRRPDERSSVQVEEPEENNKEKTAIESSAIESDKTSEKAPMATHRRQQSAKMAPPTPLGSAPPNSSGGRKQMELEEAEAEEQRQNEQEEEEDEEEEEEKCSNYNHKRHFACPFELPTTSWFFNATGLKPIKSQAFASIKARLSAAQGFRRRSFDDQEGDNDINIILQPSDLDEIEKQTRAKFAHLRFSCMSHDVKRELQQVAGGFKMYSGADLPDSSAQVSPRCIGHEPDSTNSSGSSTSESRQQQHQQHQNTPMPTTTTTCDKAQTSTTTTKANVREDLQLAKCLLDQDYNRTVRLFIEKSALNWNFNSFTFDALCCGRSLTQLLLHLFDYYNLYNIFKLDFVKVLKCFRLLEFGYHSTNPYHNSVHAADVTQAMHCFIQEHKIRKHMTSLEILCSILAAVCHDLDHPGVNQSFLVATNNPLASLYQNNSVLENHHWRFALCIFREAKLFDHFSGQVLSDMKEQLKHLILATDIARQNEYLIRFQNLTSSQTFSMQNTDDRALVLQMALKCADLGNPCRPWLISRVWSNLICDEFYKMGQIERRLGVPLTAICQREKTSIAGIQADFFKFIVLPLLELWHKFLQSPLSSLLMANFDHNYKRWQRANRIVQQLRRRKSVACLGPLDEHQDQREADAADQRRRSSIEITGSVSIRHHNDDDDDDDDDDDNHSSDKQTSAADDGRCCTQIHQHPADPNTTTTTTYTSNNINRTAPTIHDAGLRCHQRPTNAYQLHSFAKIKRASSDYIKSGNGKLEFLRDFQLDRIIERSPMILRSKRFARQRVVHDETEKLLLATRRHSDCGDGARTMQSRFSAIGPDSSLLYSSAQVN